MAVVELIQLLEYIVQLGHMKYHNRLYIQSYIHKNRNIDYTYHQCIRLGIYKFHWHHNHCPQNQEFGIHKLKKVQSYAKWKILLWSSLPWHKEQDRNFERLWD